MIKDHLLSGRKEQKMHTKKKILYAANTLLKSQQALTMDNVAKEAGISRATIYRYYSNTESIATELILQLNVPDAKTLLEAYQGREVEEALTEIQDRYLSFIFQNEHPSREFLAAYLSSTAPKIKRGQNRITTVKSYFANNPTGLNPKAIENITHISILLMGIEAILVTKDICGLDNAQSKEVLQWGLQMMIKGCLEKD